VSDINTGILFNQQSPESIKEAVLQFELIQDKFDPAIIRAHSLQFGRNIFEEKLKQFINEKSNDFFPDKK
jgi:hypothetical protein